jgi:hypothetical protein
MAMAPRNCNWWPSVKSYILVIGRNYSNAKEVDIYIANCKHGKVEMRTKFWGWNLKRRGYAGTFGLQGMYENKLQRLNTEDVQWIKLAD